MKLQLEYHHDETWRLCPEATDHWIGLVVEKATGDEVMSFASQACENYELAMQTAKALVEKSK